MKKLALTALIGVIAAGSFAQTSNGPGPQSVNASVAATLIVDHFLSFTCAATVSTEVTAPTSTFTGNAAYSVTSNAPWTIGVSNPFSAHPAGGTGTVATSASVPSGAGGATTVNGNIVLTASGFNFADNPGTYTGNITVTVTQSS